MFGVKTWGSKGVKITNKLKRRSKGGCVGHEKKILCGPPERGVRTFNYRALRYESLENNTRGEIYSFCLSHRIFLSIAKKTGMHAKRQKVCSRNTGSQKASQFDVYCQRCHIGGPPKDGTWPPEVHKGALCLTSLTGGFRRDRFQSPVPETREDMIRSVVKAGG